MPEGARKMSPQEESVIIDPAYLEEVAKGRGRELPKVANDTDDEVSGVRRKPDVADRGPQEMGDVPQEVEAAAGERFEAGSEAAAALPERAGFSSKARELFSGLSEKGRTLASSMYERVKNAGGSVVESMRERIAAWRAPELLQQAEAKKAALLAEVQNQEQRAEGRREAAGNEDRELAQVEQLFAKLGKSLSPEDKARVGERIAALQAEESAARAAAEAARAEIAQVDADVQKHQAVVEQIAQKQDAALSEREQGHDGAIYALQKNQESCRARVVESNNVIGDIDASLAQLRVLRGGLRSQETRRVVDAEMVRLGQQRSRLESEKQALFAQDQVLQKKIDAEVARREQVQAKRRALPWKQTRPSPPEQPMELGEADMLDVRQVSPPPVPAAELTGDKLKASPVLDEEPTSAASTDEKEDTPPVPEPDEPKTADDTLELTEADLEDVQDAGKEQKETEPRQTGDALIRAWNKSHKSRALKIGTIKMSDDARKEVHRLLGEPMTQEDAVKYIADAFVKRHGKNTTMELTAGELKTVATVERFVQNVFKKAKKKGV